MIPLAIIDDHCLFRAALAVQIEAAGLYTISQQSANGKQFIEELNYDLPPSIVLLDIIMPGMNGFDTAFWISSNCAHTRIIVMSMLSDATTVTRMLKNGASAFITKDAEPEELRKALAAVQNNTIFINEHVYRNLLPAINRKTTLPSAREDQKVNSLTAREKEFLKLLCTGKAYKEIASIMYVSPRTIDGYRDALFRKIGVSTKVDLVTFAIRNHFAKP